MKSVESIGKNVEQAIENGLNELGVTRDMVTIEVKETGGLFKKAKVVLTLDGEGASEKEDRVKRIEELEELEKRGELDTDFSTLLKDEKVEVSENLSLKNETKEKFEESNDEANVSLADENETSDDVVESSSDTNASTMSSGALKVKEFVDGLLIKMGIDAVAEINETSDAINVELVGKNAFKIIGKRGDGLNAFQYISNIVASRFDKDCGRVYVNACGYKEEREQELIKLARKLKYSAVRDEKPIKLEPMSAYDRKTIHKALADDDLVETHSEGEEPRRYIVIEPKKQNI